MPYLINAQLPDSVLHVLPSHVQDVYHEGFDHACDEYRQDEVRAHRVAWAAVKREYHKHATDQWV